MKYSIFKITLLLFFSSALFGQSKYESSMQKAFELWKMNKSNEATALFERISQVENDNWLPPYYAANVLIMQSFQDSTVNLKNERLKKAEALIAEAHSRSPENSEIVTMEGLLYTGYVAMDPETYGMMYSQKIMGLHQTAIALDPENPRALANSVEFEMGAARFFNQDMAPLCQKLEDILPKFDAQKSDTPFYPSFGKERIVQVIESCK